MYVQDLVFSVWYFGLRAGLGFRLKDLGFFVWISSVAFRA